MLKGVNNHVAAVLPSDDTPTFALLIEDCPILELNSGDGIVFQRNPALTELQINGTKYAFIPVDDVIGAVQEDGNNDESPDNSQ